MNTSGHWDRLAQHRAQQQIQKPGGNGLPPEDDEFFSWLQSEKQIESQLHYQELDHWKRLQFLREYGGTLPKPTIDFFDWLGQAKGMATGQYDRLDHPGKVELLREYGRSLPKEN